MDETPTPGEENHTPVGSVANGILFPAGTQDFENVTLGDEASAIRDWRIDSTSGIKGIFTSHVVNNVDGTVALHGTLTRWLRVRDQDARDIRNRIYTAAVESPAVHDYTWSFRVNLEEPPAAGANAPALVVQHRLGAVFVNTWGIVFRGGTVHLFVTSSGGDVAATPLYELTGITGIGQWVDIEIDVDLTAGVVIASVNGQMKGGLPIAPDDRIDRSSHRLCYEGSGVGNVGTTLIDDMGVVVDTASSPPPGPGPDPGPGITFTSIDATSVSGAIVLRWEVVGAELLTGFRISRWDDRDPTVIVVANVSPGTRTHIDANVRGGRTYTYVVTALLLSGAEVASPEVTASVSNRPRVLFHSLSAYASDTRVWLGWSLEGEESVVGYRLYRRESGGDETLIAGEDRLGNGMHAYEDDTVELWHSYEYVVAAVAWDSTEVRSNTSMVRIVTAAAALSQSSPNPFRAQTRIEYTLPTSANVLLNVYDVRGKLVTTLDHGVREAGMHAVTWDGRDHKGRQVGAGIYFYRLATQGAVITKKMVVVR